MFFKGLGVDQDVIQVHGHLSFSDEIAEDVVHHPLKGGRRVRESKEHNGGLVQAPVRTEGGLLLVSLLNPDVVVGPTNIQLREVFSPTESVDEFRDEGRG